MYNTCVIKNISQSTQVVLGVSLATNETYTIPDSKRVGAANDDDILEGINGTSGTYQIGDGDVLFTTTSEQISHLRSGIKNVVVSSMNTDVSVKPEIKGFKLYRDDSSTPLSTSYSDVLNVSGSGAFMGTKLKFSNDDVDVKVVIDGTTVIEIPVKELRDMNYESGYNTGLNRFLGGDGYAEFEFFPTTLKYESSLVVSVKKTLSWGVDITNAHIFYSED